MAPGRIGVCEEHSCAALLGFEGEVDPLIHEQDGDTFSDRIDDGAVFPHESTIEARCYFSAPDILHASSLSGCVEGG